MPFEPSHRKFASAVTNLLTHQVALKRFIDDHAVLGIEKCVLEHLPSMFASDTAFGLTDEDVQKLAGESPIATEQRALASDKLATLQAGMQELKRLDRVRDIPSKLPNDDENHRLIAY